MSTRRKVLLTTADSVSVVKQHKAPCSDCPWARKSLAGWTGPNEPQVWVAVAHSDQTVDCHTRRSRDTRRQFQCAGAAIFRANVRKAPRYDSLLMLPPNEQTVFSNDSEFLAHHKDRW